MWFKTVKSDCNLETKKFFKLADLSPVSWGSKGLDLRGRTTQEVAGLTQQFPKRTWNMLSQQQRARLAFVILGATKQLCAKLSEVEKHLVRPVLLRRDPP